MELEHTDDASTLMLKLMQATNEVVKLTQMLITVGTELNTIKGKYNEIKAKIRSEKEKINSLKVAIRAEGNTLQKTYKEITQEKARQSVA